MSARRNGNRARCQHEGCEKFAQTRGLCKAHGGGSRCRDPSCNKLAQSRGLCIAHGGGRRCQHEGCSKLAQSKGFCISHGGGRRCTVPHCEKFSQVKGRCKSHSKLAEHSDQDDDTESERGSVRMSMSPPQTRQRVASPPSPRHAQGPRVDFAPHPFAQHHHSQDALPLPPPRSFGLTSSISSHQPLLPPHPMHAVGNRENIHHQAVYSRDEGRHWEDSHKTSGFRSHSDEELPPLPYTMAAARPMFGGMEEKRELDDPHQFPLLPSRFLRPPLATTSGALPAVSSIMAASSSTVSSHDHFIGHRHPEPVAAVEPTSIPLLSFLDRSKDTTTSQSMHPVSSWASSTATAAIASSSASSAATRQGGSPPLPSIVLPPLARNNLR